MSCEVVPVRRESEAGVTLMAVRARVTRDEQPVRLALVPAVNWGDFAFDLFDSGMAQASHLVPSFV